MLNPEISNLPIFKCLDFIIIKGTIKNCLTQQMLVKHICDKKKTVSVNKKLCVQTSVVNSLFDENALIRYSAKNVLQFIFNFLLTSYGKNLRS